MVNTMPVKDALRAEEELSSLRDPLHIAAVPFSSGGANQEKPFGETFTLENFISNKKNFFPLALARDIIKPQKKPIYNPLIYYGKSGSGKTHLLRAIANALSYTHNYDTIFYGNIEKFIQQCEQPRTDSGFDRYHTYCIDDIHLFYNNLSLQEKFIIFLDTGLYEKKQFICACSEPLGFHKGISESLRSRLALGQIAHLKNPDLEVRMRFTQAQCLLHDIAISREHILLLAQRCEHLRYLSGVLLKIAAYKTLTQREITTQDIEKILRNSGAHSPLTPQDIISRVAEYFALSPESLTGKQRKPALAFARQAAMYLCREILGTSYPVLGQIFGGKDHSTVIYSIKKIEQYIVAHKNAHIKMTELKNICANSCG